MSDFFFVISDDTADYLDRQSTSRSVNRLNPVAGIRPSPEYVAPDDDDTAPDRAAS